MTQTQKTEIRYLSTVCAETGLVHTGERRCLGGAFVPVDGHGLPLAMRAVPSTWVEHEALPVTVGCGWGDRTGGLTCPRLPIWTEQDADGMSAETMADGTIRVVEHPGVARPGGDVRPEWIPAFERVVAACRAAHARAIAERPDVASVCAEYAGVLARIDDQYARAARRWAADRERIARLFRRATVRLGEQTVPGKVCVRSTRGTLLGYAAVRDGVWLGTVERAS